MQKYKRWFVFAMVAILVVMTQNTVHALANCPPGFNAEIDRQVGDSDSSAIGGTANTYGLGIGQLTVLDTVWMIDGEEVDGPIVTVPTDKSGVKKLTCEVTYEDPDNDNKPATCTLTQEVEVEEVLGVKATWSNN